MSPNSIARRRCSQIPEVYRVSRPMSAPIPRSTSMAWCGTTFCASKAVAGRYRGAIAEGQGRPRRGPAHEIWPWRSAPRWRRWSAKRGCPSDHVAETPPGPPVLAPVVAEVYGPTRRSPPRPGRARSWASWPQRPISPMSARYLEAPHNRIEFTVDRMSRRPRFTASRSRRSTARSRWPTGGFRGRGRCPATHNLEQTTVIVLQSPLGGADESGQPAGVCRCPRPRGGTVPLGELGQLCRSADRSAHLSQGPARGRLRDGRSGRLAGRAACTGCWPGGSRLWPRLQGGTMGR